MSFGRIVQRISPTLCAGRLRHLIDIVQPGATQDSAGGIVPSSAIVYDNVWASIEALNGSEKFAASEFVSEVSHQIVIRYIGPAPSWQAITDYTQGFVTLDSNDNLQQAQSAGLSGADEPTWNQTVGGSTADGDPSTGLTWQNLGAPLDRTGITSAMLVWFQHRVFQIVAVLNPDERNKMLILQCVEINDSRQQDTSGQPANLT